MPEGIGYGGSNVVAGTGKDLNYIGIHCFAYSGSIANDGSNETTLLEFQTSRKYIKGKVQTGYSFTGDTADTFRFKVYFNDIIIYEFLDDGAQFYGDPHIPINVVIPPFTNVKVTGANVASSAAKLIMANVTGKLY
jgi:hypothetical protein